MTARPADPGATWKDDEHKHEWLWEDAGGACAPYPSRCWYCGAQPTAEDLRKLMGALL